MVAERVRIIKDQHIDKNHLSNEEEILEVRENMNKAEKKKIAIKLHSLDMQHTIDWLKCLKVLEERIMNR